MNIVMITSGSYPYGNAATNRTLSIAKGLAELNHVVNILCINPAKNQCKKSNKIKIQYNGINIQYTCKTTKWPKRKLKKFLIFSKGMFNSFKTLKDINKNSKIDIAIILLTNPIIIEFYIKWFKKRNIKILHERTEYPFVNIKNNIFYIKILLPIYLKYTINKFDGIYTINHELTNYFKSIIKKPVKIETILMTVEPERFNIKKSENCENYIAYCGTMWGNKDGVHILIEAFSKITFDFPDIKLYMIGDTSNEGEFKKIKEKISLLEIEDKVVFTGFISSDEIPHLLVNTKMLVLARPDNIQAKGGFPTKLGEYLATGNPIVVTSVGEIPNYLIDGVNAFLAEPDSVDSFASKMKFVLNNIDLANNVGLKGKELANFVFNYKIQTKKLIDFINSI